MSGLGRLFGFLLLPLKSAYRKAKRQCAACGRDKKHDGKNSRRVGERKGKKDRASPEVRGAGIFCPVGVVGLLFRLRWGFYGVYLTLKPICFLGVGFSCFSISSSR